MLLLEDRLDSERLLSLPAGPRALYLHDGQARIGGRPNSPVATLFTDSAIEVTGHGTLWRFEVAHRPPGWRVPPEDRDRPLMARPLARDPSLPVVMRLD